MGQEVVRGQTVEVVTADGRIKRTTDPSMRWGTLKYRWREMLPGQKARLVFQLMLLVVAVALAIRTMGHQSSDQGLIGFIASGQWDRSVNLFSLTTTVSPLAFMVRQLSCTISRRKSMISTVAPAIMTVAVRENRFTLRSH